MNLGIAGRTAIVCAGSRGLGRACAEALAAEGVAIVLNARGHARLERAAAEIAAASGVSVTPLAADIATPAGRASLLAAAPDPDILVTNAGGPAPGSIDSWTEQDWDQALAGNLRAPVALIGATIEGMERRGFGRIVNITSSVVRHPIDVQGLSAAARAGLHGIVSTLVRGAVRHNVTINNVLPGPFATDRLIGNMAHTAERSGISVDRALADRKAELPARRFGEPAELGRLVAFLCSREAGYITGQSILIDGGAHPQIL